jgi:hypothetical protein
METGMKAENGDRPYRPSNGTEGEIFMSRWCFKCIKESGCTILTGALAGKTPKQWRKGQAGSRCTSFQDQRRETTYRCKKTPDLFGGGV